MSARNDQLPGNVYERQVMGRALRIMRENAGLTRSALATLLHASWSSVQRLEDGQRWPTSDTLSRWRIATGAGPLWLSLAHAEAEMGEASPPAE